MKFGILTSAALPYLNSSDRSLKDILIESGHSCETIVWDELESQNFQSSHQDVIDAYIIRSTWDYYKNLKYFLKVMSGLPAPLINSADLVHWNADKKYLLDLEKFGVSIVPTLIVERKSQLDNVKIPWERLVAKPSVSASSFLTFLLDKAEVENAAPQFEKILNHSGLMLQPFIPEIQKSGEVSLIYFCIGNLPRFSHGVLKTAKAGEFRIQNEFGGTVQGYQPSQDEQSFCEDVLSKVSQSWVYARVDFIRSERGLLLCELEMIEPELFMSFSPESAELFYQAISEYLKIS